MAGGAAERAVLVPEVRDNDFERMFDANARFANQLIFGVAKNEWRSDGIVIQFECTHFSFISG